MTIMDIFTLAERGGIYTTALITIIIIQVIKQSKINSQYMPLISLGVGFVTGIIVAYFTKTSVFVGSVDGIVAGAVASGAFDAIKATYNSLFLNNDNKNKEDK